MVKITISADTAQDCTKTLELLAPFIESSKTPKKKSGEHYKAYAWLKGLNQKGVTHAGISG